MLSSIFLNNPHGLLDHQIRRYSTSQSILLIYIHYFHSRLFRVAPPFLKVSVMFPINEVLSLIPTVGLILILIDTLALQSYLRSHILRCVGIYLLYVYCLMKQFSRVTPWPFPVFLFLNLGVKIIIYIDSDFQGQERCKIEIY